MSELHQFLETLKQPEYVHMLLNPLPLYGTALGVLALVIGLVCRSPAAQRIALLIVAVSTLSVWPVMHYGDAGEDRVHDIVNQEGQQWLSAHEDRAETFAALFYATAAVAVAAMLLPWKLPKLGPWLGVATLVLSLGCLAAGGWIARAGGQVRHSEFRHGPPPAEDLH